MVDVRNFITYHKYSWIQFFFLQFFITSKHKTHKTEERSFHSTTDMYTVNVWEVSQYSLSVKF